MATKIEDVFRFLETRIPAQIPLLTGKVKITREDEPYPGHIKDYGVRCYLPSEGAKDIAAKKLGNIIHETWHPRVDFIFNRNLKSRELYSDSLGLSYWENIITSTLLNQTNNGAFVTSRWEFEGQENSGDCVILKGIYHVEIANRY